MLVSLAPLVVHPAPPTIREYQKVFTTYPFSDPNPIPVVGRIYPYFRFDGFTATPVQKSWKVVELENDYLRVMILPEIGGKIWSAIDKRSGRPFIYANSVVKFRDIAMRGPWTSGGIEANYGIIGHTPNVATPVDYVTRTNADGSISCIIGALDLLTRTPWRLEIRLGKDDAALSTSSFWYNASPLEQPYYSWMNAGIPVDGKLQYVYLGTSYLGHNGEFGRWPIDSLGRDLSWYDNNNFGGYKSYHVFGTATDFFGAYWHDKDFGMVRWSPRDEKPGKKIWIWGLSRQGMIWEDLLTDRDGQYSEVQSGRLFNQAAEQSTFTPFRHRGFAPHTADRWTEWWYPVAGTKGFATAGRIGALNVTDRGDRLVLALSPSVPIADSVLILRDGQTISAKYVTRRAGELYLDSITAVPGAARSGLRVMIGGEVIDYAPTQNATTMLQRPLIAPATLNWNSATGLHAQGKEWLRQREYAMAKVFLDSALVLDPNSVPALDDRAMLAVREGQAALAAALTRRALSIDTYDPSANFYSALQNRTGNPADARDGFEIAASSPDFRGAAWTELARMYLADNNPAMVQAYVAKALSVDQGNLDAIGFAIVGARRRADRITRDRLIATLDSLDPLSLTVRVERLLASGVTDLVPKLTGVIRAELPEQVLLELAAWYVSVNETLVATQLLEAAGDHPEALYWRASLTDPRNGRAIAALIDRANAQSPRFVFPFRLELMPALHEAARRTTNWKPTYYLMLSAWGQGDLSGARTLLDTLADLPDFAPFYAARATFPGRTTEQAQRDLERAVALEPGEWRFGKLLSDHLVAHGKAAEAVPIATRYRARFPANYILGLTLAKAQVAAAQYAEADALLAKLSILPYEGAADGRALYRQAKLMIATQAISSRRWDEAAKHIAAARVWPERLGAGKPYDADTDQRLEDWLLADMLTRRGKQTAAEALWIKIANSPLTSGSASDVLPLWALTRLGRTAEAQERLVDWSPARIAAGTDGAVIAAWQAHRAAGAANAPRDSLRYGVGSWIADSLGSHRAVVRVDTAAEAVAVRIPWRRRDTTPELVNAVVVSAATNLPDAAIVVPGKKGLLLLLEQK
jgi:tetratricopeptide (TPR) repeat protein